MLLSTNVGTTFDRKKPPTPGRATVGQRAFFYRQVLGQRERNVTVTLAVPPTVGLLHYTAQVGGMNVPLFNEFLEQARQRLNDDELVYFIYQWSSGSSQCY